MHVAPETVCKVCQQIFCCADCCRKHAVKQHAIAVHRSAGPASDTALDSSKSSASMETIYLFCPICEQRPLPLQEHMYDEMLAHIAAQHLPLRCRKCSKVYTRVDDLRHFSRCVQPAALCWTSNGHADANADHTGDTDASKVTLKRAPVAQTTISTQTSPLHGSLAAADLLTELVTPFPVMNLRWQTKSKLLQHDEFISGGDSVSSIRNISSICNNSVQRSVSGVTGDYCGNGSVQHIASSQRLKGKLVRTTSTPVHAGLCFVKPKEQTFNGSGGYVSSIHHSGCDSDHSPANGVAAAATNTTTSPRQSVADQLQRYRKMGGGGGRSKLTAQTPLRQVMSKSIQKAMAEHGLPGDTAMAAPGGSPLDLRLSPARRRTQTTNSSNAKCTAEPESASGSGSGSRVRHEILLASTKQLTTESIVITRTHRLSGCDAGGANINRANPSTHSCSVELSNASDKSTNSSSSSSTASVYQTCRSVEIITATEVTAEEVYASSRNASNAVPAGAQQTLLKATKAQTDIAELYTPITRIPGAVINKKLINFETPALEGGAVGGSGSTGAHEQHALQTPNMKTSGHTKAASISPTTETFYTPSSSPMAMPREYAADDSSHASGGSNKSSSGHRPNVSRNLSGFFDVTTMRGRPSYRRANSQTRKRLERDERVENVVELDGGGGQDDNDEVFLHSTMLQREMRPNRGGATSREPEDGATFGRSWSLGAIVSSVMRLPSLRGGAVAETPTTTPLPTDETTVNSASSILRRCASIAGSLVRSKSLTDAEQIKAMKRKRTYTLECSAVSYKTATVSSSPPSSPPNTEGHVTSVASKRFRIQPRKPIQRMRTPNNT